jgi:RimJ/RimL family protein N-acetyltransferase
MTQLIDFEVDDLSRIYTWHADPALQIKLGLSHEPGIRETAELVDSWIKDPRNLLKMIHHRHQIIGYIRYAGICRDHGFCELHTVVGEKEFIGTKICVDIVDAAMWFAFDFLKMNHVSTFVLGNNPKLYRTALKYGFKLEGTLRQLIRTESGDRVDYHIFGMLKDEFKRRG